MKKISIRKRLIFIAIFFAVLGFVLSGIMFVASAEYEYRQLNKQGLATGICNGIEDRIDTVEANIIAGLPFGTSSYIGWIDVAAQCYTDSEVQAPSSVQSIGLFRSNIFTWQFLINWLFWSALLYVFVNIVVKIYTKIS